MLFSTKKTVNIWILFLAFGATLALSAPNANGQDWAKKMFAEYLHDFGTVSKEKQPTYQFEITNLYKEDIRIKNVFSSCGCTTATISEPVIKSRGKAYVNCRYNTHLFDGFKQATVTVQFDAPYYGEVQLTVRGNIVDGVTVSPKTIDFGQATVESLPERSIEISRRGSTFQIVDVKSTFPHIGVKLAEKSRGNGMTTYEMTSVLKDSVPRGFAQGELFLVGMDQGRRFEMPIKFSGKVVSSLRLAPETLTLTDIPQGEEITRKIICKADVPFRITDVTCESSSFKVRADGDQKKTHIIEISYTGNEPPGRHEWDLEFQTDLDGTSKAQMKAIVEVVAPTTQEAEPTNESDVASSDGE